MKGAAESLSDSLSKNLCSEKDAELSSFHLRTEVTMAKKYV